MGTAPRAEINKFIKATSECEHDRGPSVFSLIAVAAPVTTQITRIPENRTAHSGPAHTPAQSSKLSYT